MAVYAILPTRNPTEELLRAALIEAENIVNSRPLTHVPTDPATERARTPNDFLRQGRTPHSSLSADDTTPTLKNTWRTSQVMANHFWERWLKEYLPDITRRSKWLETSPPLQLNDLVVVVDPSLSRNEWRMTFPEVSRSLNDFSRSFYDFYRSF